jgi:putative lipoprotein
MQRWRALPSTPAAKVVALKQPAAIRCVARGLTLHLPGVWWREMLRRIALLALAALALGSCRPADDNAAPALDAEPAVDADVPRPSAASDGTDILVGGVWVLVTYQAESGFEEAAPPNERYTIEFTADGRVAGQADCNRYSGGYSEPAPGRLAMGPNLAVTMAACAPESRSQDFLRAVGAATRYELVGAELKLFGGGDALTFAREAAVTSPDAAAPPAPTAPQAAAPEVGRTFVYDCDAAVSFTVRTGPGEVALWIPASLGGAYVVLSQTRSASGARYAEGETVYWSKGDVATFEIGGQRFVDCRSNPAKVPWADAARRGVVFRGLGQEPAWNVEIEREGKIVLVTDYGAKRTEGLSSNPAVAAPRTTYGTADAALRVDVERRVCTDSMSGEAFEATVTVTLADRVLHGCGRYL